MKQMYVEENVCFEEAQRVALRRTRQVGGSIASDAEKLAKPFAL